MESDEDADSMDILMNRLLRDGYATASVKDGRIFMFSVDTLLDLLESAADNHSEHVTLFIRADDGSDGTEPKQGMN